MPEPFVVHTADDLKRGLHSGNLGLFTGLLRHIVAHPEKAIGYGRTQDGQDVVDILRELVAASQGLEIRVAALSAFCALADPGS